MGAVATFDFGVFKARFPELSGLSPDQAQAMFDEATLYLRNDGTGPIIDAGQQRALLNLLTAHIATLGALGADGQLASPLVGRISSASEGSVSISTDASGLPGEAAWFAQTKYGLEFWQATSPFRSMRYVPSRRAAWFGTGARW